MKPVAYIALGAVMASAVFGLLPAAHGANDMSTYRQLDLFSQAFDTVRKNYVRPVQDSELVNAAIDGMVTGLDPHSSYMDPKSYADMQIQTKGEFGGVGIEVTMEDGLIKVISPIDDTPAAKAGIKTGDFIAAIDGTAIQGPRSQRGDRQDARVPRDRK
ncbi:MAG: PDZ domain-containing protein [Rhizomicrobium sp.]